MKMSDKGRALLIQREGYKTKAYKDSKGIWTIGVGHTSAAGEPKVTQGLIISKAEVDAILARDLRQFEFAVSHAVTVPLTQGQFDALVSFAFNIGSGGFRSSTVVRRLNVGNYRGAADALLMWCKPPEITGRRKSERQQFLAATGGAAVGAPVRFVSADALHEDESISADYLRASGSRTLDATDLIKGAAKTVFGADVVDAVAQAPDALQRVQDAYAGLQHGVDVLELVKSYWPLAAGLALTAVIAWLAWRAWKAAHHIEAARIEDASFATAKEL